MTTLSLRSRLGALAALSVVSTSSAADYAWQVDGTSNTWSTSAGDTNWFIDGGATLSPWTDGNAALFTAATGESVALAGTVTPASVAFSSNGNWTLSGSGVIAGTGSLTKSGTGTLTITTSAASTFSGGTVINGGTLSLGTGGTAADTTTVSALGSGGVTVNAGGTLRLWIRNNATFTIANALAVNGGTISNEDGIYTLSGPVTVGASGATLRSKWSTKNLTFTGVLSGTGAVTVARSADGGGHPDSAVILTNTNTYSGNTTVNSAILQLGNAVATDKGASGVIRGDLTVNTTGTVVLGFTNALGYGAGAKVNNLNIFGGTVTHTANGDNGWGLTYNFSGGLLQSTGTGNFSFGGGTAVNTQANANSATINGLIRLREGNAGNAVNFTVADGTAPVDLLVNANIVQSAAGYGITKLGAGLLQYNGTATHTGTTQVAAGTFALGNAGVFATSPIAVAGGATFLVTSPGKTVASLSAADSATLAMPTLTTGSTQVSGALNLADGGTILISPILGGGTTPGVYDLLTAGSITGSGTVAMAPASPYGATRATGTVSVSGNKVQLNLTAGGASLVWNNASASGAATGIWDTDATVNWNNGGSNDGFKAFDSVVFNDTVSGGNAKTVNVSGVVAPASITFANSTGNDYTLSAATLASGAVAGAPSLVKTGTGTVTLGANLTYGGTGGDISVGGGTLNLGGKTLLAHSKLTLSGGGTLSNGTLPVGGNIDLQSGTISAVINGAGAIAKTTGGTVVISGNSATTGAGTITEGTLQIGAGAAAGALGSGPLTLSPGATLAVNRNDSGLALANSISGTGAVLFNGTNNGDAGGGTGNGQSSYTLTGNNSGFSGTMTVTNSRIILDNANDTGTATLTTGTHGQVLISAGVYPNAFILSGTGWGEATGLLGALRLQGGTISGPVTLAGNTRITSHGGSGIISGPVGEAGGSRNLEIGGSGTATNFNTVLTLSGANTYTGTTSVGTADSRTATLNLTGSLASPAVTVHPGSTLQGNGSMAGSLTFAAGATNLGVNAGLPSALSVAGAASFNGTTTVTLTPGTGVAPGGSVTLMNYGSASASPANFALANPANYRQAIFTVGATALTLDVGAKALTWTGAGGLTWDVATTSNWSDGSASAFYQGDTVTFNDSAGAANATVSAAAGIAPAAISINNSTAVPYTFAGTGSITGGAALVKSGNGSVFVNAAMTYTGGTTIQSGAFVVDGSQVTNRQAPGANVVVNAGGTFEVRGVNALPNGVNSVNVTVNGGTLRVVSGTSAAFPTATQSHAHLGNLVLNGATVELTDVGTGTAYSGESFQLNGSVTVTGTSPSVISSTAATAIQGVALTANRTFHVPNVTGDAAPDLTITAEVENSDSNAGSLIKTGVGTLSLAAANSYSAGTTVSAGTLMLGNGVNGSATGTGAVSVAPGASLSGDGSATGAVTIAGTLAPGTDTSAYGYLRLGTTTVTGSFQCDVSGLDYDTVDITGNLVITGGTLALNATGASAPSYLIATYSGTRTGSFNVTGLPSGYAVVYDETVTPRQIRLEQSSGSAYDVWAAANGISGVGAEVDSDGDGIPNGIEFVIGGSPSGVASSSSALLPSVAVDATHMTITFRRTDESAAFNPYIEFGSTLTGWTPAQDGINNVVITASDDFYGAGIDRVQVRIPRALAVGGKLFARLRVDIP